jgi:hypothetical protein
MTTTEIVKAETTAIATVTDPSVFEAYADSVAPRSIIGTLLKFSKGDYLAGEEAAPVPVGSVFTANVGELMVGWVRWWDSKPTEHRMIRLADGEPLPKRSELGDTDESTWELDSNGKARDPWQFVNYLPLLSETGELFTFTTSSRGGLGAVAELCRRYSRHHRHHPDVLPIIALDVDSYQHKQKEFGRIKFPKFNPLGYAPKSVFDDALAAAGYAANEPEPPPTVQADDELNDKIPF